MVVTKQLSDTLDSSKQLAGHSFTAGWLLNSLRQNDKRYRQLHGNRPVKDITAFDVSGGKGFLSIVLQCTVTFVDSITDDSDNYTTILKIPGFDSFKDDFLTDQLRVTFTEFHKSECDFYDILAPILDGPTPKIFKTVEWILGESEGCIHMEDLTMRGRTMTYFDTVNLEQIKCIIQHLAHMHKNILCSDTKIWKGKHLKSSKGFLGVLDMMNASVEVLMKNCDFEDKFRPLISKYHKLCRSTDFYLYSYQQAHKDLQLPSVIVQGDMHPGNIMWGIDKNENIQNEVAAIVDWQTMHEGSPMTDLARFLVHCADGDIRREAEKFAVEYYFECLIKEFGDISKVPYTLEQLKKAYNFAFLVQALYSIGVMDFFVPGLEEKVKDVNLRKALHDSGMLKSLYAIQDADKLLENDMQELFVKYGQ